MPDLKLLQGHLKTQQSLEVQEDLRHSIPGSSLLLNEFLGLHLFEF